MFLELVEFEVPAVVRRLCKLALNALLLAEVLQQELELILSE